MKYLDNLELESLELKLSSASRRYALNVCLESYSCKMINVEKREFRALKERLQEEGVSESALRLGRSQTLRGIESLSGETLRNVVMSDAQVQRNANPQSQGRSRTTSTSSATGYHSDTVLRPEPTITAKDYYCLQVTLEQAFNGYFQDTDSERFSIEPEFPIVQRYINEFCDVYASKYFDHYDELWNSIENEIHPRNCVIYSFRPDRSTEPYSRNLMAQFNYFFHNRSLKRILFFSMIVKDSPPEDAVDESEFDDLY